MSGRGSYTIPDGNMFEGAARNRPEITDGHAEPFRFAWPDHRWSTRDYSRTQVGEPARGPAGHGRWMAVTMNGDTMPYCVARICRTSIRLRHQHSARPRLRNRVNKSPNNTDAEPPR